MRIRAAFTGLDESLLEPDGSLRPEALAEIKRLGAAKFAVIVPSPAGPSPELVAKVPGAHVARRPHGLGWAAAVQEILERTAL